MKNTVRFDWAIKRLLRNKANFGILEGLLSELLGEDIKIENVLESESNKEHQDNKSNRVDLLAENTKGELVIIEVQSDYMQDYLMRMLFGTSKIVVDNMDAGMMYGKIKKVISVNIVYFDLGHGEDYLYHGGTQFVGMNKHDVLNLSKQEQLVYHTEQISKIYPEYYIIKVNQFNEVAKNTLDEWINFLKNEVVKDGSKAKGLKEAKEKLDVLKLSREEKKEYDRYIANWRDNESAMVSNFIAGELKGKNEGIEIGVELGKGIGEANKEEYAEERALAEKRQFAKNCLNEGMSVEMAAKLTGLTVEEVALLK
jgi:predicted transposase/invertase (TIGR01784 family)